MQTTAQQLLAHWPTVYRLAYHLSGSRHDAEEIAQEALLRGLQRMGQFQPGTSMRAWLTRIATNVFLDDRRRRRAAPYDATITSQADPGKAAPARIEAAELAEQLQQAIAQLPDLHRVVFLLRTNEEFPFSDIARIIGTSAAGARWHMLQARRELMRLLNGRL